MIKINIKKITMEWNKLPTEEDLKYEYNRIANVLWGLYDNKFISYDELGTKLGRIKYEYDVSLSKIYGQEGR